MDKDLKNKTSIDIPPASPKGDGDTMAPLSSEGPWVPQAAFGH